MNGLKGVSLQEKKGSSMRFCMHITQSMSDTPLENLELGARPYNSLKRAGYNTVGELVDDLTEGKELSRIRNCGRNSIREIMIQLFLFQYYSLPAERRESYLLEVVGMNVK